MSIGNGRWRLCLPGILSVLVAASGCQILPDQGLSGPADQLLTRGLGAAPRMRWGAYPSAILGTPFLGPRLGTHGYAYRVSEKDGIVYTCRGGHIDIAHLRIAADWTAYLAAQTYHHLMNHDRGFSYKLAVDHSREYVQFTYPADWDQRAEPQRRAIAREIALAAGPYMTYTMTTWHEILTWFGFKCIGLPNEFPSAFSWEDSYSNLLGTILAVRALQDAQHPFNEALQIVLDEEMVKLGIQPLNVARQASESVQGRWSTGSLTMFVTMRKRNFDIGLGDGQVTPSLVPDVPSCADAQPLSYPVPTLDILARHGFAMTLEIEPHEWESSAILRIAYGDKPPKRVSHAQFPIIMDSIRKDATARYPEFDYVAYEDGGSPRAEPAGP